MELWIRGQEKDFLIKVDNVIMDDEDFSLYNQNEDMQCVLGKYKTKERALEVLDEIQNILKPQLLVRRNDDNDKVLLGALQKGVTQKLDMEFKELSTYVYEMPQE